MNNDAVIVRSTTDLVYTFTVPARKGYYYLALEAPSLPSAKEKAREVSGQLPEVSGYPSQKSIFGSINQLVVPKSFKERFRDFGFAHRYVKVRLDSYPRRTGHKAYLPE